MLSVVARCLIGFFLYAVSSAIVFAENNSGQIPAISDSYLLQPGDVIELIVWKEPDLTRELLIGPDGYVSISLVGSIAASGKTLSELRKTVQSSLSTYVNSPSVTVNLRGVGGSKIYVIGRVLRPGEFPLNQPTDILQALSKAGGLTPFADANKIKIIRRVEGKQSVMDFNYDHISRGKGLDKNILLVSGDTILVP
jgi:polysaccharide biosynthesis/export protein